MFNINLRGVGKELLTHKEYARAASKRLAQISKEFSDGFQFIEDYPKSISFFGSTKFTEDNPLYQDARRLGQRITQELQYSVVTGGGPGIMEAANRGAFEVGGQSLGHLIELPNEQPENKFMTAHVSYHYFFVRKVMLSFSAEAFIFYPGGFGTLDEFFEMLTLVQTRKIKNIPLICVGIDYWSSLRELIEREMLARGAIEELDLSLFHVTDSHDYIMEIIKNVPVREGVPLSSELAEAHQK